MPDYWTRRLAQTPLERRPRREPQTYQELSPQLDFLYRAEGQFTQWVQFADAKAGGVILILSIGALDVFRNANDMIDAHSGKHPVLGWLSLVAFVLAIGLIGVTITGIARTLFPTIRPSKPSDFFFGVASRYATGDAYAESARRKNEDDIIEHVAIQAWNLARIANDKYANLRYAYATGILFLVFWGVARVALALSS